MTQWRTQIWVWQESNRNDVDVTRQRMGLLNGLSMTRAEYKILSHKKEKYMEDALRMKEELQREEGEEEGEEADPDAGNAPAARCASCWCCC